MAVRVALGRTSALVAAALLLGATLRIVRWSWDGSLWLDESLLALNVVDRSFGGLLGSLDYAQGAPPLFLVLVKAATAVFGDGPRALRLVPLLLGLLALPLFHAVARRIVRPSAVLPAVLLFVSLGSGIAYAAQVKQYSTDVFVALALTYGGLGVLRPDAVRLRRVVVFGIASTLAITLSFASPFVVASVAAVWIATAVAVPARRAAALRAVAVVALPWAVGLGAFATTAYGRLRSLRAAVARGDSYFMPFPPTTGADLRWYLSAASGLLRGTLQLDVVVAVLVAAAALAGAASLARRDPARLVLLCGPLVAVLAASALHRYPFSGRFVLFLSPFVVLLAAEGVDRLRRLGRAPVAAAALTVAAVVVVDPLVRAAVAAADPPRIEEVAPLLARLRTDAAPGDVLFVSRSAQYPLAYYAQTGALTRPDGRQLWPLERAAADAALRSAPPQLWIGTYDGSDAARYAPQLRRLRGFPRVWVLASHLPAHGPGSADFYERRLDSLGSRRAAIRTPGAALYLYDLRDARRAAARAATA